MTIQSNDSLAVDVTPIVRYSPIQYRLVLTTGLLVAVSFLAYGVAKGETVGVAAGLGGVLFVGLFAWGVRDKLRASGIALARERDSLVGGALDRPLLISETTFEIASDNRGSWIIILRSRDATIRLSAGGWRVEGERFVTRDVAEQVLLALGLKQRIR